MGDVVDFRKARKRLERGKHHERAAENRLRHSRGKAERELGRAREAKVRRSLDQHRVEAGDER
jgi:hypothetical protein